MENTNDQSNEGEFPGYPHYPAKEDIMNSGVNKRVDVDVENLSRSKAVSSSGLSDRSVKPLQAEATDSNNTVPGDIDDDVASVNEIDETDITTEDLIALGEESATFGTIEKLPDEDLDIPGAEEDDANEEIGEEDEENNYYSLGGDAHENLEEDKGG
jgi:hypothetical protein